MWTLLKGIFFGIGVVSITATHLVHASIFQYPVSLINIVFLSLLVVLFVFETAAIAPLGMMIFFIIDLYSTLTPFGVVLFAGTIGTLVAIWLHRGFFTNRSWAAAAGVSILSLSVYRGIYTLLLAVYTIIGPGIGVTWKLLFMAIAWEIALTSIAVALIIFTLSVFITSLRRGAIDQPLTWLS